MNWCGTLIAIIKDRLEVIQKLKYLVLDEERYSTEIDHIQPFIEKNYWIFGEQYYLVTAEEPDFEEALRRYLYVLRGEDHPKGTIHIDSMHRQKEMDIFAVQRRLDGTVKKCIVVELKRPSKVLGSKELQQVKNFMVFCLHFCSLWKHKSRQKIRENGHVWGHGIAFPIPKYFSKIIILRLTLR